jgi:hypothetical protein
MVSLFIFQNNGSIDLVLELIDELTFFVVARKFIGDSIKEIDCSGHVLSSQSDLGADFRGN